MNVLEFARKLAEFPFLRAILPRNASGNCTADLIGYIDVKRGDRNLLEVTPRWSCDDAGTYGENTQYRRFWLVTTGETIPLESAERRSVVPHGNRRNKAAESISAQLVTLNREVLFIVELHVNYWDFDEAEEKKPNATVYKMQDFDWRRYCQSHAPSMVTA